MSVVVLCYHSISNQSNNSLLNKYSITREVFEWQVKFLIKRGFKFISLGDLLDWMQLKKSLSRKSILISFDDCYTDLMVAVDAFKIRRWFGTTGIRAAAHEYRDFAFYRMPQGILNSASLGLPVIILSQLFGHDTAGQYSIITVILGAPVMLIGQAVSEVLLKKITRALQTNTADASSLLRAVSKTYLEPPT